MQLLHRQQIKLGLLDRDEHIRQFAIGLLQRLGPNAVLRHSETIRQLAISPTESTKVREMAERVLALKPQ